MRQIVHRLQHAQLLASVAVVIVALLTFGFVALIGGGQHKHIQTNAMIDDLHASVVQIGAVHSGVTTTNTVTDAQLQAFQQTRMQVADRLRDLQPRFDDPTVFERLESRFMAYIDAVDALIVAAKAGTLAANGDAVRARAAIALFDHAEAIREAREYLTAESTSAWNVARIGLAGAIVFLVVTVLAITRLTERRLRRALLDKERSRLAHEQALQLSALLEHSSDAIIVLDASGRVRYASPAIEGILRRPASEIVGSVASDLLHPDDFAANDPARRQFFGEGDVAQSVTSVTRVRRADGEWTWIEAVATNRRDVPGIDGIVVNIRDITERRRVEEQLRFHALHDPLTGLANRTTFTAHVGKALQRVRRTGASFAVMFLDLDNFKRINDTWGHAAGDELLIGVAGRLRDVLRESDTAARQGGDEFVLLIEDVSSVGDALAVAERIHAALASPFEVNGQQHVTSASIGIHITGRSDIATVADILRYADIAMYRAKHDGRNRTVVYNVVETDRRELASA